MICDSGRLQAYLDGELSPSDLQEVAAHLQSCPACQTEMAELRQSSELITMGLALYDPPPADVPSTSLAWADFQASTQPSGVSLWQSLNRRLSQMSRSFTPHKTVFRVAAIAAMALIIVVGLFTIVPAREAVAQFLDIFRVQRIVSLPIGQIDEDRLVGMTEMLDSGEYGEVEFLREPGEPQIVANIADATALAGYAVKSPNEMPEGSALSKMQVVSGPHVRFDIDRETMELAVLALGIEDAKLPAVDRISAEADIPFVVHQHYDVDNPYGNAEAWFEVVQAPIPDVAIPAGVDPTLMGELYLRLAGVPAQEAYQLAQTIDWTSTLVVPVPTEAISSAEMEINGQPALLIRGATEADGYRQRLLMWQHDGIMYAIQAERLSDSAVMQLAESMQ